MDNNTDIQFCAPCVDLKREAALGIHIKYGDANRAFYLVGVEMESYHHGFHYKKVYQLLTYCPYCGRRPKAEEKKELRSFIK